MLGLHIPVTIQTLTAPHGEFRLTPQEGKEVSDKVRWLRRVANPFVDLYVITSIGAAGSSVDTGAAHRTEDMITRDHAKGL